MKQLLIDLLKGLEAVIPPPQNCHHALMYAQYGSDGEGWDEKLALQINSGGVFTCFFLDDADLEKRPADLAAEVAALLGEPNPAAQYGVGFGQFLAE